MLDTIVAMPIFIYYMMPAFFPCWGHTSFRCYAVIIFIFLEYTLRLLLFAIR